MTVYSIHLNSGRSYLIPLYETPILPKSVLRVLNKTLSNVNMMINEKVKITNENSVVVENELLSVQAHHAYRSAPM